MEARALEQLSKSRRAGFTVDISGKVLETAQRTSATHCPRMGFPLVSWSGIMRHARLGTHVSLKCARLRKAQCDDEERL